MILSRTEVGVDISEGEESRVREESSPERRSEERCVFYRL